MSGIDVKLPAKLIPILYKSKKKHKCIKGGRGSAKSESVARYYIFESIKDDWKGNILCLRSIQLSIASSVKDLLTRIIRDYNLESYFTILRDEIVINKNGYRFLFKGCNTLADMKSKTGKGLNDIAAVWWEEASTATENELDIIIPSIRGVKLPDGTEIPPQFIYTYNSQDCPCVLSNMIETHQESEICVIHYFDNPFLPETTRKEIENLKIVAPEKYKEIYLGEPAFNNSGQVILQIWIDSAMRLFKPENDGEYVTALDPFDEGSDAHGCALRKGLALLDVQEWQDGDTGDATRRMVKEVISGRETHVIYDSVGVGAGVKAELNRLKSDHPEKMKHIKTITPHSNGDKVHSGLKDYRIRGVSTGVKNKDQFANFGAQQWFYVREMLENAYLFEQGKWKGEYMTINPNIKHIQKLIVQLKQIKFEFDGALRIRINKKPNNEKSPNMADAVQMVFRKPKKMFDAIM